MSRSHKLAWAAGFIDGEGYVTIERRTRFSKRTNENTLYHSLKLGVNHVHPAPIDELVGLFGGNVRYDAKVKGNRKPRYSWTLPPRLSKEVIIQIMPYLRNKKNVASLALEFQGLMEVNTTKQLSNEAIEKRDWYALEIRRINSES